MIVDAQGKPIEKYDRGEVELDKLGCVTLTITAFVLLSLTLYFCGAQKKPISQEDAYDKTIEWMKHNDCVGAAVFNSKTNEIKCIKQKRNREHDTDTN